MKYLLLLLLLGSFSLQAQMDKERAQTLNEKAMERLAEGKVKVAAAMLKEATRLDSLVIDYPINHAYVYMVDRQYQRAAGLLAPLTKHPETDDRVWEMLGDVYDRSGDSVKAINTYKKGLQAFPKSGYLHQALGDQFFEARLIDQALGYYEKGIKVAPYFPGNYFQAAKTHMGGSEEVWGMIYGELFLNLERSTNRTLQMSFLLNRMYQKEIDLFEDGFVRVSFSRGAGVDVENDFEKGEEVLLPFGVVYESLLQEALQGVQQLNISSLSAMRQRFLKLYYEKGYQESYPNPLFAYQKRIADAGHLEAYNYWVLIGANQEPFAEWYQQNKEKWKAFMEWFQENPIQFDE